ncbi:MAG: YggS family pyridoxal phosphate-dependent enzyme [Flavobacteriaceae bacterium]|nr:YggS family pyridoxal phosphate-dependent enzyme [Flavobacteriaceae bacterium]
MIAENLKCILKEIPAGVTLVAVSKTKSVSDILEAYSAGQRDFGENKIQEMVGKYEQLPKDVRWHMIGHVQTNKIKYMASFVSLIHGVDQEKTLLEIDKQAKKYRRIIPCLLQVKIADEDTKFGFHPDEVATLLNSDFLKKLPNTKVVGLMGMATFTEDTAQIKSEFHFLKSLFDKWKDTYSWTTLSMGMSQDYATAVASGSNMIRVGSKIFGSR